MKQLTTKGILLGAVLLAMALGSTALVIGLRSAKEDAPSGASTEDHAEP